MQLWKPIDWRAKSWRQRAMLLLTVIVILLFASHPELRPMLPLFDALGVDLVLVFLGGQLLSYVSALLAFVSPYLPKLNLYPLFVILFAGCAPYYFVRFSSLIERPKSKV